MQKSGRLMKQCLFMAGDIAKLHNNVIMRNSKSMLLSWKNTWKKSTEKSRYRLFDKITTLFEEINEELTCTGIKLCINSEYAPDYLKGAAEQYAEAWQIDETAFVHGRGHRKTTQQRHYEKLREYAAKLEEYVGKLKI